MFANPVVRSGASLTAGTKVAVTDGNPRWRMPRTANPNDTDVYVAEVLKSPIMQTFATTRFGKRSHDEMLSFMALVSGRRRLVYIPKTHPDVITGNLEDWNSPLELAGAAA